MLIYGIFYLYYYYLINYIYDKYGTGVYFAQDINDASSYTQPISYLGKNYKVVFMCRLNPYKIRIAYVGKNRLYDLLILNLQKK